jgi:putative endonuclease
MSGASMPSARQGLGRLGEAAAAAHLRRAGYRIVAQNWRCAAGELDLIAYQGDQLVFVEVRTRRAGSAHGPTPEESVGRVKARRLAALAYAYLEQAEQPADGLWRIDLIAVEVGVDGRILRLEQIESAVGEA